MKNILIFLSLLQISTIAFSQKSNADSIFIPIGQLGEKLGTILTVTGVIVEGDAKGYADGLNIKIQLINENATQHLIQIPVLPYFGKFGDKALPKLQIGSTYRLRVYETGEFVGVPSETYKEAGITLQTTGFYFQNKLVVIAGKKVDAVIVSPENFSGQYALLSGIAKNENDTAVIQLSKSTIKLVGYKKWNDSELGKPADVYGIIKETKKKGAYYVENGEARLSRLEDQIGQPVKLRGRAISMNGYWWFNYRGSDIYVDKMKLLPNWTVDNHFRSMEISGILEQAYLPDLEQITLRKTPDNKKYYIVRNASWKPVELLAPEIPDED